MLDIKFVCNNPEVVKQNIKNKFQEEKLSLVEQAEAFLSGLGLGQLRVRLHGALARIEVLPDQFSTVLAHRDAIVQTFLALGCSYVTLDLTGNETLS